MKRLLIVICMLVIGFGTMAQTELYNRYASNTNIKVACVSNLALDSVSKVEVTILEALDEEGWRWILKEFNLGSQPEGELSVMFSMRNRHNPSESAPILNNQVNMNESCYIGVDYKEHTLYIFASEAGSKKDAIVKYLLNKMMGLTN